MKEFINSKFGLWLLGAIFLAFIPWIVKNQMLSYQEQHTRSLALMELATEIDHRIFYISKIDKNFSQYKRNDLILAFFGLEKQLLRGRKYYNFKPAYAKFTDQSLLGLTIQYARMKEQAYSHIYAELRKELESFKDNFLAKFGEIESDAIPSDRLVAANEHLSRIVRVWSKVKGES
jgi:hypothetical protein